MIIALFVALGISYCAYYYFLKKRRNKPSIIICALIFICFISAGMAVSSFSNKILADEASAQASYNDQKYIIDYAKGKINSQSFIEAKQALQNYISKYPTGSFISEANQLLAQMEPLATEQVKKETEQTKREEEALRPQRQEAFKQWAIKVLENANEIDKQWAELDDILSDNNRARVYKNIK